MTRLGYCPNCDEKDRIGWLIPNPPQALDTVKRCHCNRCRKKYTLGQHGTLAQARRRTGALAGWIVRRHKIAHKKR